MAEEAGWGAWVRLIPSPGDTFVGELGHSTRNSGRERMIGSSKATWLSLGEGRRKGTSSLILPNLGQQ